MNEKRIANRIAREMVSNDIMIAEAILHLIFGSPRAANKIIRLTDKFRSEISSDEQGGVMREDVYYGVRKALKRSAPQLGNRLIDMWAAAIADLTIFGFKVEPALIKKSVAAIQNSGVADTAQWFRDIMPVLLKEVKGMFEMVFFASTASDKTAKSMYENVIVSVLKKLGRQDIDPRHVEGYLRLEFRTLDALSRSDFLKETKQIVRDIDKDPRGAESNARSFGL